MLLHFNALSVTLMKFYLPFAEGFPSRRCCWKEQPSRIPGSVQAARQQERLCGCLVLDGCSSRAALPWLCGFFVLQDAAEGAGKLAMSNPQLHPVAPGCISGTSCSGQAPWGCPRSFPSPGRSFSLCRATLEPPELGLLFPARLWALPALCLWLHPSLCFPDILLWFHPA